MRKIIDRSPSVLVYWSATTAILITGCARIAMAESDPTPGTVLQDFFGVIGNLKGMKWQMAVASIITVLISTLKVSAWRPLWDKLGWFKGFLAPTLSVGSIVLIAWGTGQLSWGTLLVAITTGAGAVALHELLDAFKGIPGIGKVWVAIIEILGKLFGGKPASIEKK